MRRGDLAKALTITPNEARKHGLELNQDGVRRSAYDLLAYPDVDLVRLTAIWPELRAIDGKSAERAGNRGALCGLSRPADGGCRALCAARNSGLIPDDLDFSLLPGLSNELKQKMQDRSRGRSPKRSESTA